MIHRKRISFFLPKAFALFHLFSITFDMLRADEEMFLAAFSFAREVTDLPEGNAGGVLCPLAPVHEVGVQAEDAQLCPGGVFEPVGGVHGNEDGTTSC